MFRIFLTFLICSQIPTLLCLVLDSTESQIHHENRTKAKAEEGTLFGLTKLCVESQPDGIIVVEETKGPKQEVLVLFKVDSFWMHPIEKLAELMRGVQSGSKKFVFDQSNQLISKQYWPNIPDMPKFIVSPLGLPPDDSFHSNVFVFKEDKLFRYKIEQLSLNENLLITKLIGIYSIRTWVYLVLNDLTSLFIPRDSKVILAGKENSITLANYFDYTIHAYVASELTLENPIHYYVSEFKGPQKPVGVRYYYQLNGNQTLSYNQALDKLCLHKTCVKVRDVSHCNQEINSFIHGFAYFLWQDTDFTIRTTIITLSSIMVINFTLAISFIYHQIRRIADLT